MTTASKVPPLFTRGASADRNSNACQLVGTNRPTTLSDVELRSEAENIYLE